MISISTNNLAYRIGTNNILENVSFAIEEGDHLAVVGVNGSGKSTLLKMLSGDYEPDEGSVFIAKDKTLGMLHQDDAFNVLKIDLPEGDVSSIVNETVLGQMYAVFPDLVRAEMKLERLQNELSSASPDDHDRINQITTEYNATNNRYIRDGGLHYKSRCRSILVNLGFPEEVFSSPVAQLSGGQRTRLALARLLSREPDILILDEPTNHLDTETMEWLESHLAAYNKNKTIILVSHDRLFLDRVTNKTLDIENRTAELYKVSYSQYVPEKEKRRREWQKKYDLQQKEIARIEAYIEQQRRWGRERNIIAAESREKALDRMVKIAKPTELPKSIRFTLESSGESGNDVVEIKKLTMGFDGNMLFRNLSFLVKKHDRLFISGPNGCGKSTLIKLLLGFLEPISGEIEFGYNVTVGYYDQENQNLDENSTVIDELWNAYPNLTQTEIRNTLALFLFRGDDIEKQVSVLSGGERARLTLAKLILSRMNLLILDEPTNHLDIESREALETALREFDGTIICVSHDRYFTRRLATRFVDIGAGGLDFRGSYDDYESYKAAKKSGNGENSQGKSAESAQKEEYLERKKANAEKRRAEKHKADVAKEIKKLEVELVDLDNYLTSDEATADYVTAAEKYDRKITVEDRLMQLYEEEETFTRDECEV